MNKTTNRITSIQYQPSISPQLPLYKTNYVMNNFFLTNLQHKRASADVKSYLQCYRRKHRHNSIEREYEESMKVMMFNESSQRRGFKGKKHCQSSPIKNMDKIVGKSAKMYTDSGGNYNFSKALSNSQVISKYDNIQQIDSKDAISKEKYSSTKRQQNGLISRQKGYHRPNLMYNLSLCRKSYRRKKQSSKNNAKQYFNHTHCHLTINPNL